MGFFDFLFSGGENSQLKKHIKRLNNLNVQQEERLMSAQWLADQASPEAIAGLLRRFSLTYEKQMKDIEEKEYLLRLLIRVGSSVIEPAKQWLRKNDNFAFPLQLVENFEGEEVTIAFLLELLGLEMDPFKPEKKRQLIIKLGDYTDSQMISPVSACLLDFDEEVRLRAVETLIKQDPSQTKDAFLNALANPEEESNRLRIRLAEIFHQRGWSLGEKAERLESNPPVGWMVTADRMVPAV
jgi:hypothetical protein